MERCRPLSTLFVVQALILLLQLRSSWSQIGYYLGTKTASKCFSVVGVPRLDFHQCRPNEMILIQEAFQGIGQDAAQCIYRRGDCIEPTTPETESKLNEECLGMPSCSITVGVAWMPDCKAYSNYNYVIYQCVPKQEVLDVCSNMDRPMFRMGFITSPGYPAKYPTNQECQCNITTDAGQKILLKFLDGNVEWSERCVKDVVQIADGSSKMPRCGKLPRNYNITSRNNRVELYFASDAWTQTKGFLLQVEALGNLLISCGSLKPEASTTTTTESSTTDSTTLTTTTLITTTTTDGDDDYDNYYEQGGGEHELDAYFYTDGFQNTGLPTLQIWPDSGIHNHGLDSATTDPEDKGNVGPLVGIIIGSILVLVIIVILIVMCIWTRRHRKKEQISKAPHESYITRLQRRNQGNNSNHGSCGSSHGNQQRRQCLDLPPPLLPGGLGHGSPCSMLSKASDGTDRTDLDGKSVRSSKSDKSRTSKKDKKVKIKP